MSKANRYDEFRIEEREHTPPVVIDREGHERVTTKVERALWEILNRDDDKYRIANLKARVTDLENALRGMLEVKCQLCGCPSDDCKAHPANALVIGQALKALGL